MPITAKAAVLVLTITLATGAALGVARVVQTRDRLDETYAVQARSIIGLIRSQLARHPDDFQETNDLLGQIVDTHPTILRVRLFREGDDGLPELWASSFHTDLPVDTPPDVLVADRVPLNRVVDLGGQRSLLHVEPVTMPNGIVSVGTYFSAGKRDEALNLVKQETFFDTLIVIAVELVALIAVMYVLVLRRVKRLGNAANAVAAGDLSVRLPEGDEEPGRDELVNVAGEFSRMVEALQDREREHEMDARARRQLLARLLRAEEEERARIAGDLHDDTIQKLTIVGLNLHRVQRNVQDAEQQAVLKQVEESVTLALNRARHLMFELAPPSLEHEGLEMALRQYLTKAGSDGEFSFTLEDRLPQDPSSETRNLAYRIAQEAIVNVRKHAGARDVEVVLVPYRAGVRVTIHDDGVGFEENGSAARPGHLGLPAMRERAALAGGWCRISSTVGEGTLVDFWLPDDDDASTQV